KNSIKWLQPAPFNDTYVILANPEIAEKYDLETLSDLGPFIANHNNEATACVGNEFMQRDDGLRGLEDAYGWKFPQDNISVIQEEMVYLQVSKGTTCNVGDGNSSTDGRIPHLGLVALKDDRHFFPPYHAALTLREATFKEYPQ